MKINVDCSHAPMADLKSREPKSRRAKSIRMRLDTKTLEKKMRNRGFKPPPKFRGLIIEIGLKNGRVHTERAFDWKGLSKEPRGWNAASSIKFLQPSLPWSRSRGGVLSPVRGLSFII